VAKQSGDDFGVAFFNGPNEKIRVGFKKSSYQFLY
jgi:hypothetical protein